MLNSCVEGYAKFDDTSVTVEGIMRCIHRNHSVLLNLSAAHCAVGQTACQNWYKARSFPSSCEIVDTSRHCPSDFILFSHRISGNTARDKDIHSSVSEQLKKNFAKSRWRVSPVPFQQSGASRRMLSRIGSYS